MFPFDAFTLGLDLARLGADAQIVIAERLTRIARGDFAAGQEAVRMVAEKALALGEVQASLVAAAAHGRLPQVGPDIVKMYSRKVRANRRRLGR